LAPFGWPELAGLDGLISPAVRMNGSSRTAAEAAAGVGCSDERGGCVGFLMLACFFFFQFELAGGCSDGAGCWLGWTSQPTSSR